MLLLTLPEIAQFADGTRENVWLTQDSKLGRRTGLNTEALALIESIFFGAGMVLVGILVIASIWS